LDWGGGGTYWLEEEKGFHILGKILFGQWGEQVRYRLAVYAVD